LPRLSRELLLITFGYGALFALGLIDNARGPTYPNLLTTFKLGPGPGSWFFTISSIGSLISLLSNKWWLRQKGPFQSLILFNLLMAAGAFLIFVGTFIFHQFYAVLFASMIFGMGSGGSGISMNIIIATNAPSHLRRQIYGGLHSMYGIASLLAPFLANYFLDDKWPELFAWLALIPLTLAILFYRLKYKFQLSSPSIPNSEQGLKYQTIKKKKLRPEHLIAIGLSSYVAAEVLVSTRLVYYLTQTGQFSLASARLYLVLFFVLLTIGRLTLALVKIPISNFNLIIFGLYATAIIQMAGLYVAPICLSLTGLSMSFIFPTGMDYISQLFGAKNSAPIIALTMLMNGIFIILIHLVTGVISQHYGIFTALHLVFILLALSHLLLWLSRKRIHLS